LGKAWSNELLAVAGPHEKVKQTGYRGCERAEKGTQSSMKRPESVLKRRKPLGRRAIKKVEKEDTGWWGEKPFG